MSGWTTHRNAYGPASSAAHRVVDLPDARHDLADEDGLSRELRVSENIRRRAGSPASWLWNWSVNGSPAGAGERPRLERDVRRGERHHGPLLLALLPPTTASAMPPASIATPATPPPSPRASRSGPASRGGERGRGHDPDRDDEGRDRRGRRREREQDPREPVQDGDDHEHDPDREQDGQDQAVAERRLHRAIPDRRSRSTSRSASASQPSRCSRAYQRKKIVAMNPHRIRPPTIFIVRPATS